MVTRFLRTVLITLAVLIALVVALDPPYADFTPRAKLSEVVLLMSAAKTELTVRCREGRLVPGTGAENGIDERVPESRYVESLAVRVDGPTHMQIGAELKQITQEFWLFRMLVHQSVVIQSGTNLVLEGSCGNRTPAWRYAETGIPAKYLPPLN